MGNYRGSWGRRNVHLEYVYVYSDEVCRYMFIIMPNSDAKMSISFLIMTNETSSYSASLAPE